VVFSLKDELAYKEAAQHEEHAHSDPTDHHGAKSMCYFAEVV